MFCWLNRFCWSRRLLNELDDRRHTAYMSMVPGDYQGTITALSTIDHLDRLEERLERRMKREEGNQ